MIGADGVILLSVLVKAAASFSALLAAGSVFVLVALPALDQNAKTVLREQAVVFAILAAVLVAARVPLRVWFLTGGSVAGAAEPTLIDMVANSPLGESAQLRVAGLGLMLPLVLNTAVTRWLAVIGGVMVCASFALRGHSLGEPRAVMAALVTAHMAAAAFWIGVFKPLHYLARTDPRRAGWVAYEFGRAALWAVGVLVLAGAALLTLLTVDPVAALSTPYGQLVGIKLGTFVPLLALAAVNKLWITPALLMGDRDAPGRLRRSIRLEVRLVLVIVAITAVLTTITSPAVPVAQASNSASQ